MKALTHGSLFSGIGGFERGAEFSGIKTLWSCEIMPFQQKILKKNFNIKKIYGDIKRVKHPRYVDIISGGFPCTDISISGKGEGINGEKSGLWSEMLRVIRQVRPKYAIIENSPALTFRGFEKILLNFYEIGYNAEWQCLSNSMFGFPHKRERIYIIANSNKIGQQSYMQKNGNINSIFRKTTSNSHSAYSIAKRIYEIPNHTDIRIDNGFQHWTHRIGSIGNSVNPIVAHYLFECIKKHNINL